MRVSHNENEKIIFFILINEEERFDVSFYRIKLKKLTLKERERERKSRTTDGFLIYKWNFINID